MTAAVALGVLGAPGLAQAAPAGTVDAGVPLSSVVYGTGCVYTLRVPVNSSGTVTFWEKRQGSPEHLIGSDVPDGAAATLEWWPRTIGDRLVYAKQNGVVGPSTVLRVRQGYGSGGMCFAV
ncbi:hypothetical protein AAFP30_09610 [Gordonia sp. CPCC 205515]|uniref:hypothetical protein n=1 Tax=Gordonia sp. CPCC 205515 TaxID=3140791 RepID=UPI003AF3E9B9